MMVKALERTYEFGLVQFPYVLLGELVATLSTNVAGKCLDHHRQQDYGAIHFKVAKPLGGNAVFV